MTESLQRSNGSAHRRARAALPSPSEPFEARTAPTGPLVPPVTGTGPTLLGFPADVPEDDAADAWPPTGFDSGGRLVVLRRADRFGCMLLFLAGVATNVSLWLPWVAGDGAVGLALVEEGVDVLGSGPVEWSRTDQWLPLAVVCGGGLLLLLGVLLLVPAHAHRSVGVAALVVSVASAAAVLGLIAGTGWAPGRLALGMWFAVAVPAFGVLGALKAMLTAPRVTIAQR